MLLRRKIAFLSVPLALLYFILPVKAQEITLKNITIAEAQEYILNNLRLKLSFEVAPASTKDGNSLRQAYLDLKKIPPSELTAGQSQKLIIFQRLLEGKTFNPDTPVDFKEKRFDLVINPKMPSYPESLFKQIVDADPRYTIRKSNSMWILQGADPKLDKEKFSLILKNATLQEAVSQLQTLLSQHEIQYNLADILMMSQRSTSKAISLNLNNVSLSELLSRFAESFGPTFVWEVQGNLENPRGVGFLDLNPNSPMPPTPPVPSK